MKQWPQCSLLNDPKVEVQVPFTFQEEEDEDGGPSAQTYIVPYGIEGEHDENGAPLVRLCILLDAVTGEFEEVTVFGGPVAYITREAAIAVVAAALQVPPDHLAVKEATPMFEPGEITNVRAYPFWKIVVDERAYFVDQTGKLYGQVLPGIGGN